MLKVEPLTYEQYAKHFKAFVQRTSEYKVMIEFLVDFIKSSKKTELKFMSIGAGTGHFDNQVFSQCDVKVDYYGIEPNKSHFDQLTETIKTNKTKFEQVCFTEEMKPCPEYDIVLISHCLYPMDEPIDMIKHAMKFLNETGKLIIFHQTEVGVCQFYRTFMEQITFYPKRPQDDLSFSIDDIIKEVGVECIKKEISSALDVTDINSDNLDATHDLLTFFCQTDTRKLPDTIFKEMIAYVKKHSDNNMFLHPTGIICYDSKKLN